MARQNLGTSASRIETHEGATAQHINPEQQLRRLVMAHLLWEDTFYIDEAPAAAQVIQAVAQCSPATVANMAVEARSLMKLRHVPLLIVRAMAKLDKHKALVASTLAEVIQRADELAEFVAIYDPKYLSRGSDGKQKLSAQVKKGLARAFVKFDAYQLAKYNRDTGIKLRDVLFLCHAKPKDDEQAAVWKQLIDGTLAAPDTWEVALSSGADKGETFTRLIKEGNLGALALLRNLRNMAEERVDKDLIFDALNKMKLDRVLPFRFITAARYAPQWEPEIEQVMFKALMGMAKLPGKTAIICDNSGSMGAKVSAKSELSRFDAAGALAILVREICEETVVVSFGTTAHLIPARRGFALRDAIHSAPTGGSTNTQDALLLAAKKGYDRVIVITDEQSHQRVKNPLIGTKGYFLNVGNYKNGIGYGEWTHIDGWSEAVLDFIREVEL